MKIPPTRNHRQLARWINANALHYHPAPRQVTGSARVVYHPEHAGSIVKATVRQHRLSTDRKVGRLRVPGRGRESLRLEIWVDGVASWPPTRLYLHDSGETYRRHDDARAWVQANLRRVVTLQAER